MSRRGALLEPPGPATGPAPEPPPAPRGPQHGLLFRTIALLTRFQLARRLRDESDPGLFVALFAVTAIGTTIGTISVAALVTDLPLLFPALAPSVFILFFTPMSEQASPRNVILGHFLALACGLAAYWLVASWRPAAMHTGPAELNLTRCLAILLAMGLVTLVMAGLKCVHPPAAATALITAMGCLAEPMQALGLCGATLLLVLEAALLNRLLGGLPYPLWRTDPSLARTFGALAGSTQVGGSYWRRMTSHLRAGRQPD